MEPDYYYTRNKSFGVYLSDRWQVTPKLTASYGLRWDYYPFPTRVGTGLEYYIPQRSVMAICGTDGIPADCGITKARQHVDPTIGLAYRATQSTVIRAGYSMTTSPVYFAGALNIQRANFPYVYSQILQPPNSYSYSTTLQNFPALPAVSLPPAATCPWLLPRVLTLWITRTTYEATVKRGILPWSSDLQAGMPPPLT